MGCASSTSLSPSSSQRIGPAAMKAAAPSDDNCETPGSRRRRLRLERSAGSEATCTTCPSGGNITAGSNRRGNLVASHPAPPSSHAAAAAAAANPLASPSDVAAPRTPPSSSSSSLLVILSSDDRRRGTQPTTTSSATTAVAAAPSGGNASQSVGSPHTRPWESPRPPRSTSPGIRFAASGRGFMIASASAFGSGR